MGIVRRSFSAGWRHRRHRGYPRHPDRASHCQRLEARRGGDGEDPVTIRDLVRHSLRNQTDRLIIGEIRGGQASDLLNTLVRDTEEARQRPMPTTQRTPSGGSLPALEVPSVAGQGGSLAQLIAMLPINL